MFLEDTPEQVLAQRNDLMFHISEMSQALGFTNQSITHDGPMCMMVIQNIVQTFADPENFDVFVEHMQQRV